MKRIHTENALKNAAMCGVRIGRDSAAACSCLVRA